MACLGDLLSHMFVLGVTSAREALVGRCMSRSTHFGNGVLGDVLSRRLAQLVLLADVVVVFDLYLSVSIFVRDRLRTWS